jgi:hypothetical protein
VLNNVSFADTEIKNVDRADVNVIYLSSDEEENNKSGSVVAFNQQNGLGQCQLQSQRRPRRSAVRNKKIKCALCHYRCNRPTSVLNHFKVAHPQVMLSRLKRYTVLDEDEAARTLIAYKQNHTSIRVGCKPFKCRLCEYRAAQKFTLYTHIFRIHHLERYEAKRQVEILPLDEAKKTVGEYNKKFVFESGRYCLKLRSQRERVKKSTAIGQP